MVNTLNLSMESIPHKDIYLLLLPSGSDKVHRSLLVYSPYKDLMYIPFALYNDFYFLSSKFLIFYSFKYNIF